MIWLRVETKGKRGSLKTKGGEAVKRISIFLVAIALLFGATEAKAGEFDKINIYIDPLAPTCNSLNLGGAGASIVISSPSSARIGAEDPWGWTKKDIGLNVSASVLHLLDGFQTMEATEHLFPEHGYREGNVILGERPNKTEVGFYMVSSLVVMNYATTLLPKPWRYALQSIWIGVELHCVNKYYKLGVTGLRF